MPTSARTTPQSSTGSSACRTAPATLFFFCCTLFNGSPERGQAGRAHRDRRAGINAARRRRRGGLQACRPSTAGPVPLPRHPGGICRPNATSRPRDRDVARTPRMEAVIGVIDPDAQGSFFRKGQRYWRGPPNAARRESAGSLRSRTSPEPPRLPVGLAACAGLPPPRTRGAFCQARLFCDLRAHLREYTLGALEGVGGLAGRHHGALVLCGIF